DFGTARREARPRPRSAADLERRAADRRRYRAGGACRSRRQEHQAMSRETLNRVPMLVSVVMGLILSVVPLPTWLNVARPDFLVIVVLYWSIMVPRAGGLTLAFIAGLLLDASKGVVLGQHALALCLSSYIAIKLHLRVRIF